MSQATMRNLVREFGTAIGIPDLDIDEDNRCNLMFDDVAVSFELAGGDQSLFIYSLLGSIPDRDADAFHAAMLHANHLLAATRGSTLSVDPQNSDAVLIREEQLETLRLPRLESIVEDFVNVAEQWMEQLAAGTVECLPARQRSEPEQPDGGMMRV